MFHLTEARPMCGAIFSQATSRLLRIALLCRPTPPPRASHARLDPALLQRPAGRPVPERLAAVAAARTKGGSGAAR
jgi:hypothetical protein